MIPLSVEQKHVVLSIFQEDIKIVKKHFMAISFDFDERFKYEVFKDFIFAAAGMFKEIDMAIYNKNLVSKFITIQHLDKYYMEFRRKSRLPLKAFENDFLHAQEVYQKRRHEYEALQAHYQMLIAKEKSMNELKKTLEARFKEHGKRMNKEQHEALERKLKLVRKEHVDAVHMLGEHRNELNALQAKLTAFEEEHKSEFLDVYKGIKEKLEYQYSQALSFFGYEFNQALFVNSERSELIQKFKKEANIVGELNLCKYVEYYLRSVNSDVLADPKRKALLNHAKQYCKNQKERESLF